MHNKENDPALEPALRDVESIQNLDTARLALRWALERMRALERRAQDLDEGIRRADQAREKAATELDAARDLLTRRAGEALERERYYAKIEEYLSLKLGGGVDPAALAAREARLEARENELQRREIETETRVKAAQAAASEKIARAKADAHEAAERRVQEVRGEYDARGALRDREFSERMLSAHEKEAQLAALERSLEERRRRFEDFNAAQRAAMERETASISEAAADQAEFIERRVEQALAAKTSALERAWAVDKQALLEELAAWRARAREHLPELLEAKRSAALLEDQHSRLVEENRVLAQSKATLTEELTRWRSQAQSDLPALLATVRRAVEAEENAKHLEVELAATQRAAEELQAQLMSDDLSHAGRVKELSRLESALSAKLRDAERDLFRQYDAWLAREEDLRRRDQEWRVEAESRRESVEVLRAEIVAQREELRRVVAEYSRKIEAAPRPEGDGKENAQ